MTNDKLLIPNLSTTKPTFDALIATVQEELKARISGGSFAGLSRSYDSDGKCTGIYLSQQEFENPCDDADWMNHLNDCSFYFHIHFKRSSSTAECYHCQAAIFAEGLAHLIAGRIENGLPYLQDLTAYWDAEADEYRPFEATPLATLH